MLKMTDYCSSKINKWLKANNLTLDMSAIKDVNLSLIPEIKIIFIVEDSGIFNNINL